jgi:hypothetical protein
MGHTVPGGRHAERSTSTASPRTATNYSPRVHTGCALVAGAGIRAALYRSRDVGLVAGLERLFE